jgi:copper(I)-binding protein
MMVLLLRKLNTIKWTLLLLFQVNLSFSCTSPPADFTVRLAPDQVKTSVAYGSFLSDPKNDLVLTKIQCEGYDFVEWHESKIDEKGIMRMNKKPYPLSLKKNTMYSFVSGGGHLMLMGKNRKISEGERLLLTLSFSGQVDRTIKAKVIK